MSRIGIKPIALDGASLDIQVDHVVVKGSKGELSVSVPACLAVSQDEGRAVVARTVDTKGARALHGTIRSLIANAVEGVNKGYERGLEIEGVGYRAALEGQDVVLNLGFSHPIRFPVPEGIEVKIDGQTTLTISGIDKQLVGQVAAHIRFFSPVEPYKGKGVKYKGEQVRRKVGKAVA